jgi:hypothetical protein
LEPQPLKEMVCLAVWARLCPAIPELLDKDTKFQNHPLCTLVGREPSYLPLKFPSAGTSRWAISKSNRSRRSTCSLASPRPRPSPGGRQVRELPRNSPPETGKYWCPLKHTIAIRALPDADASARDALGGGILDSTGHLPFQKDAETPMSELGANTIFARGTAANNFICIASAG